MSELDVENQNMSPITEQEIQSTTPPSSPHTKAVSESILLSLKKTKKVKRNYDKLLLYPRRVLGKKILSKTNMGLTSGANSTLNKILYEVARRQCDHTAQLLQHSKRQTLTSVMVEHGARLTFTPDLFEEIQERGQEALITYATQIKNSKSKRKPKNIQKTKS